MYMGEESSSLLSFLEWLAVPQGLVRLFVHVFFVFRMLCILPVCFVAFRPLIYLCSFIKKKNHQALSSNIRDQSNPSIL